MSMNIVFVAPQDECKYCLTAFLLSHSAAEPTHIRVSTATIQHATCRKYFVLIKQVVHAQLALSVQQVWFACE